MHENGTVSPLTNSFFSRLEIGGWALDVGSTVGFS